MMCMRVKVAVECCARMEWGELCQIGCDWSESGKKSRSINDGWRITKLWVQDICLGSLQLKK